MLFSQTKQVQDIVDELNDLHKIMRNGLFEPIVVVGIPLGCVSYSVSKNIVYEFKTRLDRFNNCIKDCNYILSSKSSCQRFSLYPVDQTVSLFSLGKYRAVYNASCVFREKLKEFKSKNKTENFFVKKLRMIADDIVNIFNHEPEIISGYSSFCLLQ